MATPSQRRIEFENTKRFGSTPDPKNIPDSQKIPDLTFLQTRSYDKFLQDNTHPKHRANTGVEMVLREIFPIESYDKSIRLDYLYYELEKPRYEPDECRQLRLTYGRPFKVRLRLTKEEESIEEDVFLGDLPIMLGGGEFIINGAERVVVSQLHRSPGIDFVTETDAERKTFSCRIIPERGSWIEFHISRKETITVRIDQSSKLPIMTLLRAMDPRLGRTSDLLRIFYKSYFIKADSAKLIGKIAVSDIRHPGTDEEKANELIIESGCKIGEGHFEEIKHSNLKFIEVVDEPRNKLILNSIEEDKNASKNLITHEEAILRIYQKLRPGNPPQIEKARELFYEKFYDINRYRLGRVGRFRINRKLGTKIDDSVIRNTENSDLSLHLSFFYPKTEGDNPYPVYREEWTQGAKLENPAKETRNARAERLQKILRERDKLREQKAADGSFVEKWTKNLKIEEVHENANEMLLAPMDIVQAVIYLSTLWGGNRKVSKENYSPGYSKYIEADFDEKDKFKPDVDDIDHLGNRRLRTIDELASEELRKGFLKLRRTVQERMSMRDDVSPRQVINQKSISAAIEFFFGRGELSQVVDQTNPLSMLTHERRLSALGPGGLNRKRAGFDVRDVHSSHYGRICPIETPEGTNIGLISSLSIYAGVDEYGFLIAPYRKVKNGKVQQEIEWLRADQEHEVRVAPADIQIENGKILPDPVSGQIVVRYYGDYEPVSVEQVEYVDVSPSQMVGVSAGLIPFLEHDDANRALMGSNMQRQAVPLLISEPALVVTGLEKEAAKNSSLLIRARKSGTVTYVDAMNIVIDGDDTYNLRKFVGLNERTCQNQVPIVKTGQKVEKDQVIADGASMRNGELCLGRNVLVAFMAWDGYNFEDAIILSEEIVQKDTYTSLHIEEFDTEIRDTKLGREEFTRDIPNVGEKMLRNLDETGIIRVGTYVRAGDILVGKVTPKSKTELTPEEKLLHAIFGRAGEDVKNESLEVPSGVEGIVIGTQKFACRMSLSEEERKIFDSQLNEIEREGNRKITECFTAMIEEMQDAIGGKVLTDDDEERTPFIGETQDIKSTAANACLFRFDRVTTAEGELTDKQRDKIAVAYQKHWHFVEGAIDARDRKINSMKRGDELRRGVLQMVKVYIAAKRVISVGDKMAGRHGNKGVIAKILPQEDMPFLADGTPVQIMLNPLGVPSRMNVGQILETHLGWAAEKLGFQAVTPVFDGASEEDINECLEKAGLPKHGKVRLYDGRTGEPFDQETTVGYIYMLKLHHLVDDKVHARSTGPYSLITQQPLGGKARFGGQRFGEMEVWALEAYGAAYTLQELLTVKSDDVEGRTKIYESMVKGENTLEAGTPASFDVLTNEIRGLALNMQLEKGR